MRKDRGLSIGELAQRTGLAVSAIRYYEEQGLVHPWRNAGGQRRFARADLRRLSFVMIAQKLGLSLGEIRTELDRLPDARVPGKADWVAISSRVKARIESEIAALETMRDTLDGCIGCGCLSLETCALYNPADRAAEKGPGPRYAMGDEIG